MLGPTVVARSSAFTHLSLGSVWYLGASPEDSSRIHWGRSLEVEALPCCSLPGSEDESLAECPASQLLVSSGAIWHLAFDSGIDIEC